MKVKTTVDTEKEIIIPVEEYRLLLRLKNSVKSELEYKSKDQKMWDFMIKSAKETQIETIFKLKKHEIL